MRPNLTTALAPLKDFQRRTVDHAFQRLFLAEDSTRRFLVADEVGLGKTMVARGVIARAIDHLWETIDRLDILYICSNADIARQNINRLHPDPTSSRDFALATRITLLPLQIHDLKHNKLNFISFTPGTSFDMGHSGGQARERALIYHMLEAEWGMTGEAPYKVFSHHMRKGNFKWWIKQVCDHEADAELTRDFIKNLNMAEQQRRAKGEQTLHERFEWLCDYMRYRTNFSEKARWRQRYLLGELRLTLADACVDALEPDLIILDEFQRFKTLLDGSDAAGELAQALFRHGDAHTLLLSATPYKMYTVADERETDDHYADFLRTVQFLYHNDAAQRTRCDQLLKAYRQAMFARRLDELPTLKHKIETLLRKVMSRTEKVSAERNALLKTVHIPAQLAASDLHSFVHLNKLSDAIGERMPLSYWKSAPYLLNFMQSGYKLKRRFDERRGEEAVINCLHNGADTLLPSAAIEQYAPLDPNNARLRSLLRDTVDAGAWQMLWLPPSLPYYQLAPPFSELPTLTKRLVFSAWQVVPRAIASLVSYAAEREMLHQSEVDPHYAKRTRPLLNFVQRDDRLTGMPVLAMLYPCATLARLGDPLPRSAAPPTLNHLVEQLKTTITDHLTALNLPPNTGGRADERWYWAAPILLDRHFAHDTMNPFWEMDNLAALWQFDDKDVESKGWTEHVAVAQSLWRDGGTSDWGHPPDDLAELLAVLAVAGLGIVPLRSFGRWLPTPTCYLHAAQVGWALRSLFNTPEVTALVRQPASGKPYWRDVLDYAAAGCLQAVFDEYCHVLRESRGLFDFSDEETIADLAKTIREVVTLKTVPLSYDDLRVDDGQISSESQRIRTHFALRFGDLREDDQQLTRKEAVREAFNSPFWPFVLASTSVGQEGLDFHLYCHAVVHWNLPSNPVDLEQREGRVHRYKSHAVRKNVAHEVGDSAEFWQSCQPNGDLWQQLFNHAHAHSSGSDLVPFWIYPEHNAPFAQIERHIPAMPLSREIARFGRLQAALTVYRMAFGQNRQEDLLDYLLQQFSADEVDQLVKYAQIDLSPTSQIQYSGSDTKY